ncbi:hypothetical protein WR164_03450 [Philodulcilactobacillus myokoensis]|uniref:DUF2335 domain-containing protein n=1 Tax=Philodulcilactobacillus myokoensis TaxID=2929573 RepID=A0A9W6B0M9_9LACO|nr:hypothetical protein WR164_03450 [Philodulcilactobacillus myokoensis]
MHPDSKVRKNSNSEIKSHKDFKKLPPNLQHRLIKIQETRTSSPFPNPKMLKGYNEINPGIANKIIDSGIEESKYRRNLQKSYFEIRKKNAESLNDSRRRREWFAFVIAIILVLSTIILLFTNHYIAGTLSGFGSLALVGKFMYPNYENSNLNHNKKNASNKMAKNKK